MWKWILWLFRWKRRPFPRWFFETFKGSMKVRIGQDYSSTGELVVILQLETRENFGKWKPVAKFRYLDVPTVRVLLLEADRYMKTLLTHE